MRGAGGASQGLGRLAEGAHESPAHALLVAEAGLQGHVLDLQRLGVEQGAGRLDPQALDGLAGVAPVSAVNSRAKLRGLMAAWAASWSTVRGWDRFSRAQASRPSNRPLCISSRAENCDWPPGRR